MNALSGDPRERATGTHALRAGADDLLERESRPPQHVDGSVDGSAHHADVLDVLEAWSEEDVGAGLLERLETAIVSRKIGVPSDVVLGPGGERERGCERPSGLDRGAIRSAARSGG